MQQVRRDLATGKESLGADHLAKLGLEHLDGHLAIGEADGVSALLGSCTGLTFMRRVHVLSRAGAATQLAWAFEDYLQRCSRPLR